MEYLNNFAMVIGYFNIGVWIILTIALIIDKMQSEPIPDDVPQYRLGQLEPVNASTLHAKWKADWHREQEGSLRDEVVDFRIANGGEVEHLPLDLSIRIRASTDYYNRMMLDTGEMTFMGFRLHPEAARS